MHEIWEKYGDRFVIELLDSERKYFALDEINGNTDITRFYSKTNGWQKRTTVFWRGDVIVKTVYEQIGIQDNGSIGCITYEESDTELKTDNRGNVLPLTSRGKPKKLTATNILSPTPTGCTFYFCINNVSADPKAEIYAYSKKNSLALPIGEKERLAEIKTCDDLRGFIEYYVSSCPEDYFEKVGRMRNSAHQTVKYRVGDIFRMEVDRFRYCYGIITGGVNSIKKWDELPEHHSLRGLMSVPIMVRYYNLITDDADMNAEKLSRIPLDRLLICADNDIIWGTHTIVDHKKLTEDDLEFNLVCTKIWSRNNHNTVFTQNFLVKIGMISLPGEYSLHVEWGTAAITVPYEKISAELREYMKDYDSPHSGNMLGIPADLLLSKETSYSYKNNLLEERNRDMRNALFSCIGLPEDASFDDFAVKFGGLTKAEILKKLND